MTLAMSGATPGGRGPGLRPGQHDRAGRRRAGPGRAGHRRVEPHARPGQRRRRALVGGYHLAFALAAGLAVAAIVVALVLLRPQPAQQRESAPAGVPEAA